MVKACLEFDGTNAGFVGNNLPTTEQLTELINECALYIKPGFDKDIQTCKSKGDQNDQVQIYKYLLNQTDETLKNSVLNGHDKDQMQTFLDNYVSNGAKNVQVQTLS